MSSGSDLVDIAFGPERQGKLEEILEPGRCFDLLCRSVDDGPLSIQQLGARDRRPLDLVVEDLRVLVAFGLMDAIDDSDRGVALCAAKLDRHPDWVREAIEANRVDRQPDPR